MKKESRTNDEGIIFRDGDTVIINPINQAYEWYHDKAWTIIEFDGNTVFDSYGSWIHIDYLVHYTKQTSNKSITKQDILDIVKECWLVSCDGSMLLEPADEYPKTVATMKKIIDKRLKELQK